MRYPHALARTGGEHPDCGEPAARRVADPAARAADLSVTIDHYTFDPAVLTIAPGTTVRWINYQTDANTVTARAGPVLFRSPLLRAGESFDYTITELGTYRYTSAPHPFMADEVRVVPNERVTFPKTGYSVEGAFLRYWRGHGLDFGEPDISAWVWAVDEVIGPEDDAAAASASDAVDLFAGGDVALAEEAPS